MTNDESAKQPAVERRRNPRLRALVDEMLASIRVASGRDLWTPEQRAVYEQELATIMMRVRSEAVAGAESGATSTGSDPQTR